MSASDRTPADRRRFAEKVRLERQARYDREFADHTQQMIERVTKADER